LGKTQPFLREIVQFNKRYNMIFHSKEKSNWPLTIPKSNLVKQRQIQLSEILASCTFLRNFGLLPHKSSFMPHIRPLILPLDLFVYSTSDSFLFYLRWGSKLLSNGGGRVWIYSDLRFPLGRLEFEKTNHLNFKNWFSLYWSRLKIQNYIYHFPSYEDQS